MGHQILPSMGFPRQAYWSESPFTCPGDRPISGIKPESPAWQVDSLLLSHLRSPLKNFQFGSVTQSCPTLCNSMNRSTPGLPVHHQLLEFTQTHVHRVGDAIQPSSVVPFSSCPQSLPASGSFPVSHQVAKVLEFQPQHQSFQ